VKDAKTEECLGIVTDYSIVERMLLPKDASEDWHETLKDKQFKATDLVDKVPIYPLDFRL
jgi:hypothetical protein